MKENVEVISSPINWDEVRCRAAIAVMYADALVERLKSNNE